MTRWEMLRASTIKALDEGKWTLRGTMIDRSTILDEMDRLEAEHPEPVPPSRGACEAAAVELLMRSAIKDSATGESEKLMKRDAIWYRTVAAYLRSLHGTGKDRQVCAQRGADDWTPRKGQKGTK